MVHASTGTPRATLIASAVVREGCLLPASMLPTVLSPTPAPRASDGWVKPSSVRIVLSAVGLARSSPRLSTEPTVDECERECKRFRKRRRRGALGFVPSVELQGAPLTVVKCKTRCVTLHQRCRMIRPVANGEVTSFGALVLLHRERRNLSQPGLAQRAGLTKGYIGGIESGARGKRPSRDTVLAIAQGLGLDAAERAELLRVAGRPEVEISIDDDRPSFESFVRSDPALRSDQKQVLVATYKSFVGRSSS